MSTNLYWEPAHRNKKSPKGDDALKFALRKRSNGHVNMRMTQSDVPYLQGLVDAGIAAAQELIDAIEKHDEINVTEE